MPKIAKRVIHVTYDQYPGIELSAASLTVEEALAFDELPTGEMIEEFARKLRSWNIEDDDDQPVPATLEGLRSLDIGVMLGLIKGWSDAITQVPVPLDRRSTDTLPWEAPDFPTEVLSESLPS